LPAVVLAVDPEDAGGVEMAPDGGEGVAIAEVDAADALAGGDGAEADAAGEKWEDQALQRLE